jgi:hypothetical protein
MPPELHNTLMEARAYPAQNVHSKTCHNSWKGTRMNPKDKPKTSDHAGHDGALPLDCAGHDGALDGRDMSRP